MAPIQPSHRDKKPLKSILKSPSQPGPSSKDKSHDFFATSKKDKRRIKHAQLLNKISKANTKPKRRRPNKKLVATLDSLADALPDEDDATQHHNAAGSRPEEQVNIIKRKSLKSKPGALKRKQKLDNEERARFAKNMAQMTPTTTSASAPGGNSRAAGQDAAGSINLGRWAVLRGFISQTLEKRTDMPPAKT